MANFIDIPTEIWVLIASYIPKSQLVLLKSLNGFFLNCYMDRRWNKVLIRRIDPEFEEILQRLRCVYNHHMIVESEPDDRKEIPLLLRG